MIRYGHIKNGICYIDASNGVVVKQQLVDGRTVTICTNCYKSQNTVEEKEPKVKRGKKYWGQTLIEIEFTKMCHENKHLWLHELITSLKGPNRVCLIRNKYLYLKKSKEESVL